MLHLKPTTLLSRNLKELKIKYAILFQAVAVNSLGKWKTAAQMTSLAILLATRDSRFSASFLCLYGQFFCLLLISTKKLFLQNFFCLMFQLLGCFLNSMLISFSHLGSLGAPASLVGSGLLLLYISAGLTFWSLIAYMGKIWKVLLKQ